MRGLEMEILNAIKYLLKNINAKINTTLDMF